MGAKPYVEASNQELYRAACIYVPFTFGSLGMSTFLMMLAIFVDPAPVAFVIGAIIFITSIYTLAVAFVSKKTFVNTPVMMALLIMVLIFGICLMCSIFIYPESIGD